MSSEKQLQIIKDICQEHLDNTEIDNINKCEDYHDHYLLGKVDMATEIFEALYLHQMKIKKYKYAQLTDDAKITAREYIDRNGGDIREISKEQYDKMKNNYEKNVWNEDHLYYEERFAATSEDWEVNDLCEQNDWYFEKNGTRI
jgi:hypothetical protein